MCTQVYVSVLQDTLSSIANVLTQENYCRHGGVRRPSAR